MSPIDGSIMSLPEWCCHASVAECERRFGKVKDLSVEKTESVANETIVKQDKKKPLRRGAS